MYQGSPKEQGHRIDREIDSKVSGGIQTTSYDLRTGDAHSVDFSPGAKASQPGVPKAEDQCCISSNQAERELFLLLPFQLGLNDAFPCSKDKLLYKATDSILISPRNTLRGTSRNNVQSNIWASHDPARLTYKINPHNV